MVLSLAAWFALSNHCALGAVATSIEPALEMSGCPMQIGQRNSDGNAIDQLARLSTGNFPAVHTLRD